MSDNFRKLLEISGMEFDANTSDEDLQKLYSQNIDKIAESFSSLFKAVGATVKLPKQEKATVLFEGKKKNQCAHCKAYGHSAFATNSFGIKEVVCPAGENTEEFYANLSVNSTIELNGYEWSYQETLDSNGKSVRLFMRGKPVSAGEAKEKACTVCTLSGHNSADCPWEGWTQEDRTRVLGGAPTISQNGDVWQYREDKLVRLEVNNRATKCPNCGLRGHSKSFCNCESDSENEHEPFPVQRAAELLGISVLSLVRGVAKFNDE